MSSEKIRGLYDLDALRAVANPTRLEIIELLREHRVLTASRCAELLASTAKSCSYHLHVLARSGLVEELITADRRERPWRLTYDVMETASLDDKEVGADVAEALRVSVDHNYQAVQRFIMSRDRLTTSWHHASTATTRISSLTADELHDWATEVEELTRSHIRRAARSAKPGRERVRLVVYGFPDQGYPAATNETEPPETAG